MEIVTFYSYKGGVGRTLALSNTAGYLTKLGFNVCLLDFDLEAPGLNHKFKISDISGGIVDYIDNFINGTKELDDLKSYTYPHIGDYCIPISDFNGNSSGKLFLIPAGNTKQESYWNKLSNINWKDFLYSSNTNHDGDKIPLGIPFFLELTKNIEKEIAPDFLLVDSRTGITEIGAISTILIPNKLIIFFTNNEESIQGLCQVYRRIEKSYIVQEKSVPNIVLALTRIPNGLMEEAAIKNDIIKYLNKELNKQFIGSDIVVLHSNPRLEVTEELVINDIKGKGDVTFFTKDFLDLFNKTFPSDLIKSRIDKYVSSLFNVLSVLDYPNEVEEELERLTLNYRLPSTYETLIQFYDVRNLSITDWSKYKGVVDAYWNLLPKDIHFKSNSFNKYVQKFLNLPSYSRNDFNNEMLEVLAMVIEDQTLSSKLKRDLAITNINAGKIDTALIWYKHLFENNSSEITIEDIKNLSSIYIESGSLDECSLLLEKYDSFSNTNSYRILLLKFLIALQDSDHVRLLLKDADDSLLKELIIDRSVRFDILNKLVNLSGNPPFLGKLNFFADYYIKGEQETMVMNIFYVYSSIGLQSKLNEKLAKTEFGKKIMEKLKK